MSPLSLQLYSDGAGNGKTSQLQIIRGRREPVCERGHERRSAGANGMARSGGAAGRLIEQERLMGWAFVEAIELRRGNSGRPGFVVSGRPGESDKKRSGHGILFYRAEPACILAW